MIDTQLNNPVVKRMLGTELDLSPEDLTADDLMFLHAELCRIDLFSYAEYVFNAVEPDPDIQFLGQWWVKALCEHLEAAYAREIKRLMVMMPPRHGKTTFIRVLGPSWRWLTKPEEKFLNVTYKHDFTKEHAQLMRDLITHPMYKELLGYIPSTDNWHLKSDANKIENFKNNKLGAYMSFSLSGITGQGANIHNYDDLLSVAMSQSPKERKNVIDFYEGTLMSRSNRAMELVKIFLNQRTHEEDPTGHLLIENIEEWETLVLPAIRDPKIISYTSLGFEDPREDGEVLCEEITGPVSELEKIRRTSEYFFSAQYQQNPIPLAGGIISIEWLSNEITFADMQKIFDEGRVVDTFLSIDPAFSEKKKTNSDYTAWVKMIVYNEKLPDGTGFRTRACIADLGWDRMDYEPFEKWLLEYIKIHRITKPPIIEHSGKTLIQALRRKTPITEFIPNKSGDKYQRISRAAAELSGMQFTVLIDPDKSADHAKQMRDGINWICRYSGEGDAHDDLPDALAQEIIYLTDKVRLIKSEADRDYSQFITPQMLARQRRQVNRKKGAKQNDRIIA